MPATEYRTKPSEAATSTMQMAMKIVEMRIMCAERPQIAGPWPVKRVAQVRRRCPGRRNLSINVDSSSYCSFRTRATAVAPVPRNPLRHRADHFGDFRYDLADLVVADDQRRRQGKGVPGDAQHQVV